MSNSDIIKMMCRDIISCTEDSPQTDHRERIKIAAENILKIQDMPVVSDRRNPILESRFNMISQDQEWQWYINVRQQLSPHKLILDNDETWIAFDDDDSEEGERNLIFRNHLGNDRGIGQLLDALGIEWDGC